VTRSDSPPPLRRLVSVPTHRDHPSTRPAPVRGVDLCGAPATFDPVGRGDWALLLFLSTTCDGCADVWAASGRDEGRGFEVDSVVIVTAGPGREDSDAVRASAGEDVRTIMSDEAWAAYRVLGPPFFVLVDGVGASVATEGVVVSVDDVIEHVRWAKRKATARSGSPGGPAPSRGGGHGQARDHPRFSPGTH